MQNRFYIACLGASAGGIDPLKDFFSHITLHLPTSYVVVTHLPIDFPTHLHTILSEVAPLPVVLLSKNTMTQPNHIYVLPGHLKVKILGGVLLIRERTVYELINKAIDEFLFSLAHDQKEKSIAIILSGTGKDGADGAKAVHKEGGIVLVQDPRSAIYSSMPFAAINADKPDGILTAKKLGKKLGEIIISRNRNIHVV